MVMCNSEVTVSAILVTRV